MKKFITITSFVVAVFLLYNCKSRVQDAGENSEAAYSFEIPENVQAVLDQSCYGCHNTESKNEKGKDKLSFDKLDSEKTFVQIGIMQKIHEELDSSKMPPAKFLERYPDRAPTMEQKEIVMSWALETADKLSGK